MITLSPPPICTTFSNDSTLQKWAIELYTYLQKNVSTENIALNTASSSTDLHQFNLTNKYNSYLIILSNILLATDNTALWLRLSTDNSTWKTSGYRYAYSTALDAATGSNHGSTSASSIVLDDGLGGTSSRGYSGTIYLYNPSATTTKQYVTYQDGREDNSGNFRATFGGGCYDTAGVAIQGIQILAASGNIASGTMKVYGFLS